ncbi:DUF5358 family protein [Rodentibacter caecimuris]|uniref:DUF5358 family protein n=1 Tax=Rodentibacter caecimuris TaxID=1796644 RepID=UPI00258D0366|nr:DUF5358 family protein [Rodentibacter heylii]
MLRKITALSTILFLSGCLGMSEPAYKLSDEDTQRWVTLTNQIEQCIFPKEWKTQNLNSLSNEEKHLYFNGLIPNSLMHIIGNHNWQVLMNDPISRTYAYEQFNKFNHSHPTHFDIKWCQVQKQSYNNSLKQLRIQIKEAERKRQELETYYRTPAGQMELMRQQMAQQHREMMAQQAAIHEQQASQARWNMVNSIGRNISPTFNYNQNYQMQNINRSLNQINSTLQNMTPTQGTGPRWYNVY